MYIYTNDNVQRFIRSPAGNIYFLCSVNFSEYKSTALPVPACPFPVDRFSYSTRPDDEILQFLGMQENYARSALSAISRYDVQIDV